MLHQINEVSVALKIVAEFLELEYVLPVVFFFNYQIKLQCIP